MKALNLILALSLVATSFLQTERAFANVGAQNGVAKAAIQQKLAETEQARQEIHVLRRQIKMAKIKQGAAVFIMISAGTVAVLSNFLMDAGLYMGFVEHMWSMTPPPQAFILWGGIGMVTGGATAAGAYYYTRLKADEIQKLSEELKKAEQTLTVVADAYRNLLN
jgi:hypothetical protein